MKTTKSNNTDSEMHYDITLNKNYLNTPRFFDHDFYRLAADKFVEKYSTFKDVLSIYLFGQVSVEGISDLDFIVVLNSHLTEPLGKEYSIMSFNEDLRYIYNNTQPFLVDEEVFKNFWKIFPTSNLQLIYGKEIRHENDTIEKSTSSSYNILILIDVCNYFYPRIFLAQLYSEEMNVRYSLLILNSLKFPLLMFMDICDCKYDGWINFINKVKNLRGNWFSTEDQMRRKELHGILNEAVEISLDLVDKLNSYIKENLWSYPSIETIFIPKTLGKSFISPFDKNQIIDNEIKHFRKCGRWGSFSPLNFYFPLLVYSQNRGIISEHIKSHLPKEKIVFNITNEAFLQFMKDRIDIMNKHALFYKKNKIKINMVHDYYGYSHLASRRIVFPSLRKIRMVTSKIIFRGRV